MTVPTTSWSETTPAGSDNISLGDNRIRELKTQIREVIDVDHDFPSSGQATDVGQHKKCTFQEQADLGTGAVNATILGSQTISGKGELVYTDEDDNDIQITKSGKLKPSTSTTLADWSAIMGLVYPVGSVYINVSDSTNPGTLLGIGTWVALGAGRMIVGYDSGDTNFDSAGETGGANTVTLTTNELPAHTHTFNMSQNSAGGTTGYAVNSNAIQSATTPSTSSTGSGAAFSVLNKYVTCYTWKRTA